MQAEADDGGCWLSGRKVDRWLRGKSSVVETAEMGSQRVIVVKTGRYGYARPRAAVFIAARDRAVRGGSAGLGEAVSSFGDP